MALSLEALRVWKIRWNRAFPVYPAVLKEDTRAEGGDYLAVGGFTRLYHLS
jgi:hypothetical protein